MWLQKRNSAVCIALLDAIQKAQGLHLAACGCARLSPWQLEQRTPLNGRRLFSESQDDPPELACRENVSLLTLQRIKSEVK